MLGNHGTPTISLTDYKRRTLQCGSCGLFHLSVSLCRLEQSDLTLREQALKCRATHMPIVTSDYLPFGFDVAPIWQTVWLTPRGVVVC
jgi:hypothetical protein